MMTIWTLLIGSALADCPPVVAPVDGATTLGVKNLTGPLVITGADGDEVRAEGDVCKLTLRERKGQLFVEGSTTGGPVSLTVPQSLAAVTVYHHEGEVRITDLPSRVATVGIEGAVVTSGVPQLRADGVTGGVTQEEIATANASMP